MIRGGSVLVRLRWLTDEVEVVLGLPMSLKEEKAKEFSVHACRSACSPTSVGRKLVIVTTASMSSTVLSLAAFQK